MIWLSTRDFALGSIASDNVIAAVAVEITNADLVALLQITENHSASPAPGPFRVDHHFVPVPRLDRSHKAPFLQPSDGHIAGARARSLFFVAPLGQLVPTPGALRALAETGHAPLEFIARHASGDWGDLDEEDRRENELSVKASFRILSAYRLKDATKIWIITEADRSATTILLPEEY